MGLLEALGLRSGGNTRVAMLVSVGDHAAGESYDLPGELSDSYILRGYATGHLTREYTEVERHALTVNSQVVSS